MATPLNSTDRYIAPEVTKVYQVPSFADMRSPQRAELNGVGAWDLSKEIAAMTGWDIDGGRVPTPDLGTRFTGRITGRTNPGDAQITFYASRDTNDIRRVQRRDDEFYIFIADGGDVAGQLARVFAVQVSSVTPTINVEGSESSRVMINYSITQVAEQVLIPALS